LCYSSRPAGAAGAKTIRRRLDALKQADRERKQRTVEIRLRRQAARERRKPEERERHTGLSIEFRPQRGTARAQRTTVQNPYDEWLDRPKNLSGRARAKASGLVRIRLPEKTIRKWIARSEVDALLEAGWLLDDPA
jgi:hypothetical protein